MDAEGVAVVEEGGQAYPAAHGPEHDGLPLPADAPYLPAAHDSHTLLLPTLKLPAGHSDCELAKGRHAYPAAHGKGTADPVGQYVPAGQGLAVPDVDPGGHT
jgi:hypothetical protein